MFLKFIKVLSKAPFWAFCGEDSYPSPEGGKKLYDYI